jgi:copper resistance protein B
MRNKTMTMNPTTIRIRRALRPAALGLLLLGSSSSALAQTDAPAAASSSAPASQPMAMSHADGMHGKSPATDTRAMPAKGEPMRMPDGSMMSMPAPPIHDMSAQPMKKSAGTGSMQSMPGMSGMAMPKDMKHAKVMSKAAPIGSLPTSDGAAPKGYDTYGVTLHVHDDPLLAMVQFENLETAHSSDGANSQQWDGRFWVGHNLNKLWVRSEGSRSKGRIEEGIDEGDVEALWGHAISPFWNLMVGIRHDLGTGPTRNWTAFGFQGIAPYEFDFEATAYMGPSGRSAFRLKISQDWLFTQKLILTPKLDLNAYGRADPRRDLGAGVSDVTLSFRLRYEISRKFAPYIGYSWVRSFGTTADMARTAGRPVSDRQILLGVRAWF